MRIIRATVVSLALPLLWSSSGAALTITPNYPNAGQFNSAEKDLIGTAIAEWEAVILVNLNLTVNFKKEAFNPPAPAAAGETIYKMINGAGRITEADIKINTAAQAQFFVDPSPDVDSEFRMMTRVIKPNAAATDCIIAGRYGVATAAAAMNKWDLLSVVKHELGHALGIGRNGTDPTLPGPYVLYQNETNGGVNPINVDATFAPLFTNNTLPVLKIPVMADHLDGTQVDFGRTLMAAGGENGFNPGERSHESSVDILAIASVYDLAANEVNVSGVLCPHYLCHQVKDLKVPAKFASLIVASLDDQTGSFSNCVASKPKLLCNSVVKNGGGVADSDLHYCCYQVKCSAKVAASYDITDQFGDLRLQTKKPKFLCNPCDKAPAP